MPVLPETLADAGAAPAMHTLGDRRGNTRRFGHQGRQACGGRFALVAQLHNARF